MKQKERIEISQHWDIMEQDLSSYIEVLAYFRNLCAHDDRIYNAKCKKLISNTPTMKIYKYLKMIRINTFVVKIIYFQS